MKISEIFRSIQGETSYAGLPCSLIRLSGCNLRCSYCDTKFAYTGGQEMAPGAVAERLGPAAPRLAVLTGGEPLLQRDELLPLADNLISEGFTVLLETNGSLPVSGIPREVVVVMDIKCPSSGMSASVLWDNLEYLGKKDEAKFVLSSEEDYEWSAGVIRKFGLGEKCGLLFSPAWGLVEPVRIAERMLQDGLEARLQIQLHKVLWGGGRGR